MPTDASDDPRAFASRPGYPMSFAPVDARVRVEVAGQTIVDARRAMVMHEDGHAPVYYFERKEVRMDLLTPTDHASH